jgi:hypothetical protein
MLSGHAAPCRHHHGAILTPWHNRLVNETRTVTLWRPTGPTEWALVLASRSRRWPRRLPDQPIFYPVLNEDYAIRIARDWNVKASGVGIVTRFDVDEDYLDQFDTHQVGGQTILEYWIPAERLDEFNDHIIGEIAEVTRFELVDGRIVESRVGEGRADPHVQTSAPHPA